MTQFTPLSKSLIRFFDLNYILTLLIMLLSKDSIFKFFHFWGFLFTFVAMASTANAQLVKGMVKDKNDIPLSNSSIYIDGRLNEGYIITSYDGRFEIKAKRGDTLVVSCIGFNTKKVLINDNTTQLIITLEDELRTVEVVTALGLKRTEQELGYAIQSIEQEEIEYSKTHNFLHSLSGRVAGAQIKSSSAGPTSTVSMLIRGEATLTGSNQPLFVLNGMPITNNLFSSGDGLNGSSTIDFGNAAQILNVDDISSISILRGASAAIAYGSRAANGVVLITTKNAGEKKGWSVNFNSTNTLETILKSPDYQNEYGFGGNGKYSYNGGTTYTGDYYDAFGENWGPKLNGSMIKQWNSEGVPQAWIPQNNNIQSFYRTGFSTNNNISLTHGGQDGDFRLSFSSLYKNDIVPNSNLHRNTMLASFGQKMGKKVKLRANALYTLSGSNNIPSAGYDENSSIAYGWLWFPRNGNINDFKDYWVTGKENEQQQYAEELWVNNPYMLVNENTNSFLAHRFIADAMLNIDIIKGLSARFRGNADVHNETRQFKRAYSTRGIPFGSYRYDNIRFSELNIEGLLSFESNKEKPFKFTITQMVNIMRQSGGHTSNNAPQLNAPNLYNLGNSKTTPLIEEHNYNEGINSLLGIYTLSYKTMLHLEAGVRADWYSTLSPNSLNDDNIGIVGLKAYIYPSVTLSAIITEMVKLPKNFFLSFAKVRIAYGEVLQDAAPYLLNNVYDYSGNWESASLLSKSSQVNNPFLKPERTRSEEVGFVVKFFKNRLSFDATFYHNKNSNLILNTPTPISSGYAYRLSNNGEMTNTGAELLLTANPVERQQFSWHVTAMATFNRNKVVSLGEGITNYPIVENLFPNDEGSGLSLEAQVGKPLGQLVGLGFQKDEQGNIIHKDGLPQLTTERVSAGSYQPDWLIGLSNTITYQNFSLSFLFDGQIGGKIYSRTHALLNTGGSITNNNDPYLDLSTLDGRQEYDVSYDPTGKPIYTLINEGGVVGKGSMRDDNNNLVPNDVKVSTRDYFYAYYGNGFNRDNIEAATYDASYIKLRELRLSYNIPKRILEKIKIKSATISFVGRNLALFSATPSIDPETFSIRANQIIHGFESGQLPPTRSFSINFNITF